MLSFLPFKLLPSKSNIDFVNLKKITFLLSFIVIIFSFTSIYLYKFNYGIDFAGGISIDIRSSNSLDLSKMRTVLTKLEIGEVMLQNFGSNQDLSIRIGVNQEEKLMENIELIKNAIKDNFSNDIEYRKVDFVGPQVGTEMIRSGTFAMFLAFLAIMFYVWLRFEWYFGIGVLFALIHDVIIGLGFMSFFAYDFNLSTVAAILTIIGYSVNDSVVIYDRIRENFRIYSNKKLDYLINLSINETLSRTTVTAFTTLLANFALIVFGGEAIESFSILVFFGIVVGTYSSIFISAPILTAFKIKK